MEAQINRLVEKVQGDYQLWLSLTLTPAHILLARLASLPPDERLLIAISGIPGSGIITLASSSSSSLTKASGKTTLASLIVSRINATQDASSARSPTHPFAAFIPMDGYHLTRDQLSAMPDPSEAHRRRGAEFTFDGKAFLALVEAVRSQKPTSGAVYAPSFDHAKKDPVFNDIPILATTRVVVFEGLYLSLDKGPWREAGKLMDEMWFVEVDFETARKRLIERHVKSGVTKDAKEADERARGSDLVNGEEIVRDRLPEDKIDEIVVSREDESWHDDRQGL